MAAFEVEFAEHFGLGRPCVAVNSGTSGLHLALLALGLGPGDEVVVPSFTFAATANAVALTGATPVFADVDDHFCLDPEAVAAVVGPRTAALLPVHLYGQPAAMGRLLPLALGTASRSSRTPRRRTALRWGARRSARSVTSASSRSTPRRT